MSKSNSSLFIQIGHCSTNFNIWRVSSQNALYPFWSIWDLSCWNIKKNNKKICNTFDHNFKNIPLYIMSNVSLERYYFVLYFGALTLKMSKMALNAFCDKTLHLSIQFRRISIKFVLYTWKFVAYYFFSSILSLCNKIATMWNKTLTKLHEKTTTTEIAVAVMCLATVTNKFWR